MRKFATTLLLGLAAVTGMTNQARAEEDGCAIRADVVQSIQSKLFQVVANGNGGLFTPNWMWSAIVDRKGRLCSVITNEPNEAWPGSRSIAIAKASTANDFSNSKLALSTANLYSPTQPGGSLYGLNNSNPFNPAFQAQGTGIGQVPGGIITFGGGVALYSAGKVIGGLGVSGDSACTDHFIAYTMRKMAGFGLTPNGPGSDNIAYLAPNEPPNGFKHPTCYPSSPRPPN